MGLLNIFSEQPGQNLLKRDTFIIWSETEKRCISNVQKLKFEIGGFGPVGWEAD